MQIHHQMSLLNCWTMDILFKADVAMIKRTDLTIDTDEEKTISKDRQEGRIVQPTSGRSSLSEWFILLLGRVFCESVGMFIQDNHYVYDPEKIELVDDEFRVFCMLLLFIFRIKIHSIILQSYALIILSSFVPITEVKYLLPFPATYEDNSNATCLQEF